MPTDANGQSHAGSHGLFDDDSEHNDAIARAERHERERLEGVIRRHERREKRQQHKDQKASSRALHGKSKSPWPISWLEKLFGGGKNVSPEGTPARPVTERDDARKRSEYVIVRKPPTPEPVYTASDVDPVDSPWLRECGMVRVKSKDPGGCHIVSKSVIQKNE